MGNVEISYVFGPPVLRHGPARMAGVGEGPGDLRRMCENFGDDGVNELPDENINVLVGVGGVLYGRQCCDRVFPVGEDEGEEKGVELGEKVRTGDRVGHLQEVCCGED